MNYRNHKGNETQAIVQLFESVFTASEGAAEGALIGQLTKDLFAGTPPSDLFNFVACDNEQIVGSIFFSCLTFDTGIEAFILAPVAVQSSCQGRGIGQALISYGLNELKNSGIRFAVTYGDPAFYSKVGFEPISPSKVKAPFELSQPEGWLGMALSGDPIAEMVGNCTCVDALQKSLYW